VQIDYCQQKQNRKYFKKTDLVVALNYIEYGTYEQLESHADASWIFEFSPKVFPCGLKFHLDPCRSISSDEKL